MKQVTGFDSVDSLLQVSFHLIHGDSRAPFDIFIQIISQFLRMLYLECSTQLLEIHIICRIHV
jgi:hypothetical protein